MKISEFESGRFMRREQLDGDVVITIVRVEKEELDGFDGKKKPKAIIYTAELGKPICSGSDAVKTLNEALGTTGKDDASAWDNRKAIAFDDPNVKNLQGRPVGGIRFKKYVPPKPSIEQLDNDIPI